MLVSLSWLRRYADLPTDPSEISTALTAVGFEVESLVARGAGVTGVVVGEVKTCAKHPEADKLSVCTVFDGAETVPVVCGAPNVAAGQKVLFARVGAVLPGDFRIKKAKLRGQESFGMICAEDELGLGESHDGILVLPADSVPGTTLQDIPGLCDTTFEISVTPNRPDALGHVGVARELAARFGVPLRLPEAPLRETGPDVASLASLKVEDADGCPRYTGRVVTGVRVGPSPEWLTRALASVGKKSINNVVDVTNFVLMEWGQPSHAFDLAKLKGASGGASLVVRRASAGESLKTLDGAERKLDARDLVIADASRPQVLAGVMGGEDSGVTEATRDVLLEVAWFEPRAVRAQSRRHGLSSDSSQRFERGVDPLATAHVSDYLAALVAETCGGAVSKGRLDFAVPSHPTGPREVSLRPERAARVLGIPVDAESATALLAPLGIKAVDRNAQGTAVRFAIPGFRVDIEREADLIEEVARRVDYNAIPAVLPAFPLRPVALPPGEEQARAIRHGLRDLGLSEALSLRFMSRRALAGLGLSAEDARNSVVPLRNPLSEEWEILPTTPLPALLQSLERNQNTQEPDVRLFELGRAFFARPKDGERDTGVREEPVLGIALMGEWKDSSWGGRKQPVDFARLKGVVESLLERLRVDIRWEAGSTLGCLHPVESATLRDPVSGVVVGALGALHPAAQAAYGLKLPVVVAEISLEALLDVPRHTLKFQAYETHPGSTRDVNALVPEPLRHAEVLAAVPQDVPHLCGARLNSVYRGQGIPEGSKALHYTFSYRHPERALTDDEVGASHAKVLAALEGLAGLSIK
jgi:phenylalanyl-tRNA synthetase beta chain